MLNMIAFLHMWKSLVISTGTDGKNEVQPSVTPQVQSQGRSNLPKETQNPYGLLGSGHNQSGTGLRDWLTCTAV